MSSKSLYTKKWSRIVANDAANSNKYHVIPRNSHLWSVVPEGSTRASKIFRDRANAIHFARKIATRKLFSEIVVHDIKGGIIQKIAV